MQELRVDVILLDCVVERILLRIVAVLLAEVIFALLLRLRLALLHRFLERLLRQGLLDGTEHSVQLRRRRLLITLRGDDVTHRVDEAFAMRRRQVADVVQREVQFVGKVDIVGVGHQVRLKQCVGSGLFGG